MITKQEVQSKAQAQISTLSLFKKMEEELNSAASNGQFQTSLEVSTAELGQADQVVDSLKLRGFTATKKEEVPEGEEETVTSIEVSFSAE